MKKQKVTKAVVAAAVAPVVAAVVETVAVPAKLTKRNSTPTNAVLVTTEKAPKVRAGHNATAWAAVLAVLPCTAAELAKLPELNTAPIIAGPFISYMQRRGFLTVKS